MRHLYILRAHVLANLSALLDIMENLFTGRGIRYDIPPLMVFKKYSVDEDCNCMRTRQVGLGYWQWTGNPASPRKWTDTAIFFQETYNQETMTWTRVKKPQALSFQ